MVQPDGRRKQKVIGRSYELVKRTCRDTQDRLDCEELSEGDARQGGQEPPCPTSDKGAV